MKKIEFGGSQKEPKIEITVHVRDKNGKPTGQKRTFGSDSHGEVAGWYNKQKPQKKKRKKKKLDS
jgi:hypothetical protein